MSFLQPLLDGPGKLLRRGAVEPGICRFEQRIHWRVPPAGRVTMFWQDGRGRQRTARTRVVDMNGTGALVKSGTRLDSGCFASIRVSRAEVEGQRNFPPLQHRAVQLQNWFAVLVSYLS